jgi:hypothetical protein
MKELPLRALILALALAASALPASANDQTVVIGAGLGIHSFSDTDDVREGSALFGGEDELTQAALVHYYVEWYALDDLGFGARVMGLGAGRSYSSAADKLEQDVSIAATFLTVNWVPIGSESYVRFGVLGGIGSARYEVHEKYTDNAGTASYDETESTTGSATLLGGYIDWGGESFGARFGLDVLSTDLDKLDVAAGELEVDGSGTAFYLDLRWAFD